MEHVVHALLHHPQLVVTEQRPPQVVQPLEADDTVMVKPDSIDIVEPDSTVIMVKPDSIDIVEPDSCIIIVEPDNCTVIVEPGPGCPGAETRQHSYGETKQQTV